MLPLFSGGSDFTQMTFGILFSNFNGLSQSQPITFTILDDTVFEADETFTITVTAGDGGGTASATGTITIEDIDGKLYRSRLFHSLCMTSSLAFGTGQSTCKALQ
jgi:hypothetical protein